jgi:hypothetical protein
VDLIESVWYQYLVTLCHGVVTILPGLLTSSCSADPNCAVRHKALTSHDDCIGFISEFFATVRVFWKEERRE